MMFRDAQRLEQLEKAVQDLQGRVQLLESQNELLTREVTSLRAAKISAQPSTELRPADLQQSKHTAYAQKSGVRQLAEEQPSRSKHISNLRRMMADLQALRPLDDLLQEARDDDCEEHKQTRSWEREKDLKDIEIQSRVDALAGRMEYRRMYE